MTKDLFTRDTETILSILLAKYGSIDNEQLKELVEKRIKTYKPEDRNRGLVDRIRAGYDNAIYMYRMTRMNGYRQAAKSWAESAVFVGLAVRYNII